MLEQGFGGQAFEGIKVTADPPEVGAAFDGGDHRVEQDRGDGPIAAHRTEQTVEHRVHSGGGLDQQSHVWIAIQIKVSLQRPERHGSGRFGRRSVRVGNPSGVEDRDGLANLQGTAQAGVLGARGPPTTGPTPVGFAVLENATVGAFAALDVRIPGGSRVAPAGLEQCANALLDGLGQGDEVRADLEPF